MRSLDPKLIGKVITIQTFLRKDADSDGLDYETLEKFVGTLLGYSIHLKYHSFTFQGISEPLLVSKKLHYFEIFHPDKD